MRFDEFTQGSLMPKINFLRQKLWPVERTQTDRQTDRDSKYRRTYRFFLVIFFLIFLSMSGPKNSQRPDFCYILIDLRHHGVISFFNPRVIKDIYGTASSLFWNFGVGQANGQIVFTINFKGANLFCAKGTQDAQ